LEAAISKGGKRCWKQLGVKEEEERARSEEKEKMKKEREEREGNGVRETCGKE